MMDWSAALWESHVAVSGFLTGLIWITQVVHYPLFRKVGLDQYTAYQSEHMRRITFIVLPTMGYELLSGFGLLFLAPPFFGWPMAMANFLLIGAVWLSTFTLQGLTHMKLERQFDLRAINFLVNSNWIRTIIWTTRWAGLTSLNMIH